MRRAAVRLGVVVLVGVSAQVAQTADLFHRVPVAVGEYTVQLSGNQVSVSIPDGMFNASVGEPALPWLNILVTGERDGRTTTCRLVSLEVDTVELAAPIRATEPPVLTRDDSPGQQTAGFDPPHYADRIYPNSSVRLEASGMWQGNPVISVSWCPFRYDPERGLLEIVRRGEIWLQSGDEPGNTIEPTSASNALIAEDVRELFHSQFASMGLTRPSNGDRTGAIETGTPTDIDYVIITSESLCAPLRRLAEWRQKQGYRVGIAIVSEIDKGYPGEDTPARIRAYLADAHAGGLQFCVLGGDESIVPIRYAYHAFTDTMPAGNKMQVADLYYADLTGNWDADDDGVYGEYLQDGADVFPELYVGRLLAASPEHAATIVDKILAYESNPGKGDPSYLTRGLFTCSDQMRDWNGGEGQHAIVGANFPSHFTLDLTSASENPLGSLPDPSLPEGAQFVQQMDSGWGWTVVINHGRPDGFALRAAGINQWPKSYALTFGSDGDAHGHLNLLRQSDRPGIFLFASCDAGGFDMDSLLSGGYWGPNVSEVLTQKPHGGAVAAVAYSRWGWVGSSYRILGKFVEYAFDPTIPPQIGVVFALTKADFSYYRDQSYGLNLYGDPAMPLWTDQPKTMRVDFPQQVSVNSGAMEFVVTGDGAPLTGATVTAAYGDTIFFAGKTNANGSAIWSTGPIRLGGYEITVTKPGFLPISSHLITPIAAGLDDTDDEAGLLPMTLQQNHPNPFNPATTIEFAVPVAGQVRLEVYDILGRRVSTPLDEPLPAGDHQIAFDGVDMRGVPLASGVYFYRLQAGTTRQVRKMMLLR